MKVFSMHFTTLEHKTVLLDSVKLFQKMTALQFNSIHLTQQSKTTVFYFAAFLHIITSEIIIHLVSISRFFICGFCFCGVFCFFWGGKLWFFLVILGFFVGLLF